MTLPMFELQGVRKSFGVRNILDIERLELSAGQSYVLTGENGSGKTTLLRIMAGLETAKVDFCRFDGKVATLETYPDWMRREVIYVHQHPYLFRNSIAENISYGLKSRGIRGPERKRLVQEAIEWARVEELLNVPPQKLSGGEIQRVALARARVLHPKLFLLDEPTANLDAEARAQTLKLITDLCDAKGTVVLACHDRELIELPYLHRLHINHGKLDQSATLMTGE